MSHYRYTIHLYNQRIYVLKKKHFSKSLCKTLKTKINKVSQRCRSLIDIAPTEVTMNSRFCHVIRLALDGYSKTKQPYTIVIAINIGHNEASSSHRVIISTSYKYHSTSLQYNEILLACTCTRQKLCGNIFNVVL